MDTLTNWYEQLEMVKEYILIQDPQLKIVFDRVDNEGFQLHTMIKDPYTALICAIIGQKISYKNAKSLRSKLYSTYGNILDPKQIQSSNLSFLDQSTVSKIIGVTNYIINNNIDLTKEEGIRSLESVNGIGLWTIETTLLTCLKNWDIFPLGDKFLQTRIKRLYGITLANIEDIKTISSRWSPYKSVVTWYLWRWF